nr:hypothetical protein [Tanacetum cinerariifolium]
GDLLLFVGIRRLNEDFGVHLLRRRDEVITVARPAFQSQVVDGETDLRMGRVGHDRQTEQCQGAGEQGAFQTTQRQLRTVFAGKRDPAYGLPVDESVHHAFEHLLTAADRLWVEFMVERMLRERFQAEVPGQDGLAKRLIPTGVAGVLELLEQVVFDHGCRALKRQ